MLPSSLKDSEDQEESQESLLMPFQASLKPWRMESKSSIRLSSIAPWLLSCTSAILLVLQWRATRASQCDGTEFWRAHEIEGARREIAPKVKEIKFSGGLKIKPGVGLYREVDEGLPVYVGPPNAAIDAAWSKLIDPLNVFVTLDEAEVMGKEGMGVEPASGLYMAMPQGLHDLHCLNMIRKALHLEHYPTMNTSILQIHLDHCIDGLRQSLMCYSDMTIIKEYWTEHKGDRGGMMADFDNVHVCRDFDSIRTWMTGRNAEDDDIWPQVAGRLRGVQY